MKGSRLAVSAAGGRAKPQQITPPRGSCAEWVSSFMYIYVRPCTTRPTYDWCRSPRSRRVLGQVQSPICVQIPAASLRGKKGYCHNSGTSTGLVEFPAGSGYGLVQDPRLYNRGHLRVTRNYEGGVLWQTQDGGYG